MRSVARKAAMLNGHSPSLLARVFNIDYCQKLQAAQTDHHRSRRPGAIPVTNSKRVLVDSDPFDLPVTASQILAV